MNASRFDKIIENRAQERVSKKIDTFRADVGLALSKLHPSFKGTYYHGVQPHDISKDLAVVLGNIASGMYYQPGPFPLKPCAWPVILWTDEQALVEKELLATMDEMQKALCAPEPTKDGPQPVAKEGVT